MSWRRRRARIMHAITVTWQSNAITWVLWAGAFFLFGRASMMATGQGMCF